MTVRVLAQICPSPEAPLLVVILLSSVQLLRLKGTGSDPQTGTSLEPPSKT